MRSERKKSSVLLSPNMYIETSLSEHVSVENTSRLERIETELGFTTTVPCVYVLTTEVDTTFISMSDVQTECGIRTPYSFL